MHLRHIVAAVDESDAGRSAVRTGVDLAARSRGRLTILHTVAHAAVPAFVGARDPAVQPERERLWQWVAPELPPMDDRPPLALAVTWGVPGIEIGRYAEDHGGGLLVLGRKPRSARTRLLLGDTADAVARRSGVPCLFVPPGMRPVQRVLAALDGTDRGSRVLVAACRFAALVGAELRTVTVEPAPPGEPAELARSLPLERSARLQARVREVLGPDLPGTRLDVRRGPIVDQVLAALAETESDVLVVGYHRGGPSGVIDAGSTARRLAHTAPRSVLTIPL